MYPPAKKLKFGEANTGLEVFQTFETVKHSMSQTLSSNFSTIPSDQIQHTSHLKYSIISSDIKTSNEAGSGKILSHRFKQLESGKSPVKLHLPKVNCCHDEIICGVSCLNYQKSNMLNAAEFKSHFEQGCLWSKSHKAVAENMPKNSQVQDYSVSHLLPSQFSQAYVSNSLPFTLYPLNGADKQQDELLDSGGKTFSLNSSINHSMMINTGLFFCSM